MESLERVVDPHRQRIKDLEAQVSRLHEELNRLQDLRENAERYLTIVEDIEDGYFEVDVA
jgi:TolA-binding protein